MAPVCIAQEKSDTNFSLAAVELLSIPAFPNGVINWPRIWKLLGELGPEEHDAVIARLIQGTREDVAVSIAAPRIRHNEEFVEKPVLAKISDWTSTDQSITMWAVADSRTGFLEIGPVCLSLWVHIDSFRWLNPENRGSKGFHIFERLTGASGVLTF